MSGLQKSLHYDATFNCVQCGYCLPACPTYQVLEKESASPRGRISLVKLAAEGKIDVLEDLAEPIDLCLGCRACEAVCPTGVQYGSILEGAKATIEPRRPQENLTNKLGKFLLRQVFPYPGRLKAVTAMIWLYQATGLQKLANILGITDRLPYHLGEFEKALPDVPSPAALLAKRPADFSSVNPKARVAFFAGCMMDSVFHDTNRKSIELLQAAGCDVAVPKLQTCCGALHAHSGDLEQARELARRNIGAFEETGADWYVNNAGGCGAALLEYDHLLADDPEWSERAKRFTEKSRDITVILAELGLSFKKQMPVRITYQDSCHLRNVQKVSSQPRQLLRSIPGAAYVELPGSDSCCGSGGIYNLVQYDTSMQVLDAKMDAVEATEAALVVTSNPGCLLQMQMGIQRAGLENQMRAVHIVDLLHEACGLEASR